MLKDGLMDTGFGGRTADDTDRLARAFAGARVGLGALAADRQAAQMADAAIAFDALQPFEVHADLAAQIAFDDVFAILDGMNDLGKLLFGQVLGSNGRINLRLAQDYDRVAGADAVDITQGNVDALVRGD